ncbi:MAG: hypothetical protein ACTSXD_10260 [Candidatus Heimdallarchaeaceae archaeon]
MRRISTFFFVIFFLALMPIKATKRGEKPKISNGFCTATVQENPRKMEWIITYNPTDGVVLRESQLYQLPFSEGGYLRLTNLEYNRPVFTCTSENIYFLVFKTETLQYGQNIWREVRTILYKKNIWTTPKQAQVIYATPLSNELLDKKFKVKTNNPNLSIRILELSGLLSQQNKVVVLGKFGIHYRGDETRISYGVLNLNRDNSADLFFESGPSDISKMESACITLNDLFFVQRIGPLYTKYQVNSNGEIAPILFRWNKIGVKCNPYNATVIFNSRPNDNRTIPRIGRGRGR